MMSSDEAEIGSVIGFCFGLYFGPIIVGYIWFYDGLVLFLNGETPETPYVLLFPLLNWMFAGFPILGFPATATGAFLWLLIQWIFFGICTIIACTVGGALAGFIYASRLAIYTMFARHPAQDAVDRAIATGDRVATKELQASLEKTHDLVGNPPAPWKTKVMAEKAEELTRRLDEERRLAEKAIELDRMKQLQEWQRKHRRGDD